MLTAKKVNLIVEELQSDPEKVETLIRWIGGRVKVEIERIVARSLQYSLALFDRFPKGMTGGEVQRRMWGFLVAAYDLRERVPHNSQYLAKRDRERKERQTRVPYSNTPYAGLSTAARIESDFEIAATMAADGMTYQQVANELVRRNPKKYFRHKPSADNVRKVLKRKGFKKNKPPSKDG